MLCNIVNRGPTLVPPDVVSEQFFFITQWNLLCSLLCRKSGCSWVSLCTEIHREYIVTGFVNGQYFYYLNVNLMTHESWLGCCYLFEKLTWIRIANFNYGKLTLNIIRNYLNVLKKSTVLLGSHSIHCKELMAITLR